MLVVTGETVPAIPAGMNAKALPYFVAAFRPQGFKLLQPRRRFTA